MREPIIGKASIASTTGTVLVGQGPDGVSCSGNSFEGEFLNVVNNNLSRTGYVEVSGNSFPIGDLRVVSNKNGTALGNQDIEVEANIIAGKLWCTANSPAPTNDGYPNQAAARFGQCTGAF